MNYSKKETIRMAAKAAFPHTIPILTGFLFLGIAYGIYVRSLGFSAIYPTIMSASIFAGSMEFVAANLLTQPFNVLNALLITLLVNARHIFYGLSMLDKYSNTGKKKFFLIYGMCDESFSINLTATIPKGVDKGWFMLFVTLFNYSYWVLGATLGGVFGNLIPFDTKGIDFVMTALFIVIFMNQFDKEKNHTSSFCGIAISIISLVLFGADKFVPIAMIGILITLTGMRKKSKEKVVDVK